MERTETVNDMGTIVNDARDKLERECAGKFDRYGEAMKHAVKDALIELAKQDVDFAGAVVRGGSYEECMKTVDEKIKEMIKVRELIDLTDWKKKFAKAGVKEIKGGTISDLEVFRTAVKYYEPEADVEFQMVLKRAGSEQGGTRKAEGKIYDLLDFL